ncbi:hypothetical protein CC78DRAFT_583668 [Lojkania enalia]|uniref:Uncharacterized protein n=1 Tax=Lojkania enalia TaxID=147567 RepID=A0A9P4K7D4_9PLEO|nr:hypothetical protein CC78DRAFT_583668 [Didymosphaeria enalia]
MSYQITDLTFCPVPKGSSIVTATVHFCDSKLSLSPIALDNKLFGGEGGVIRTSQLLPDSWMLLRSRYEDSTPGPSTYGSSMLPNADHKSSSYSDAVSHKTDYSHDDGAKEDRNGEEGVDEYEPSAEAICTSTNGRINRGLTQKNSGYLRIKVGWALSWRSCLNSSQLRIPGAT